MDINEFLRIIREAMKIGRGGNDARDNCIPLTEYAIKNVLKQIFNNEPVKYQVVTTAEESGILEKTPSKELVPIKLKSKNENESPKFVLSKQEIESVVYRTQKGLYALLPPEMKIIEDSETKAQKLRISPESETVTRQKVNHAEDLNRTLMDRAKLYPGRVIYGDVALSEYHVDDGHVLAFFATEDMVGYIDGQGIKYNVGDPVFFDITEAYTFYDPSNPEHKHESEGIYQPTCFYLVYGSADFKLTGKINLEQKTKTINPKAFAITKNTTPEEVMNISKDKDTVIIEKEANETALEFIPKHIKSVDLSVDYVSYGKVKKLPQHLTKAVIGEPTSPDAVSLLSDNMRMLVIHEDTKIPTLRAIKETVTTAVVDKNLSAEKIKELENIKMIIFNGDISQAQAKALPPSVGVVSIGEGMSIETVKEICVPTVIVRKGCHPETVAALNSKVERADIGVGLTQETIAKFPPHLQMVGIRVGVTAEQVKAIPNYLRTIVLREEVNPGTVKALPPHIDTVIIGGDTRPEAIQATAESQSIKYVIVKNTTSQETRAAIPKHLKIYGEEALPAKKTPYKPSLFGSQQDSVFSGSEIHPRIRNKQ